MAKTRVVNPSTVVGNKFTKTVSKEQLLKTPHVILRELTFTSLDTQSYELFAALRNDTKHVA